MRPFDQLQAEIQDTLEKIIRVNASIARHEAQEQPDELAIAQFEEIKVQFTQHLLALLAEMDIKLKVAA
ncbi:hypothetical protein ACWKW6_29280 [Dyadobacter jiangsuensis]|jgi:hypothetical protein|uniref:hypothetical protein n=1 Tax=Dyadobacter fermentans TaxID=94254 RepID=UPI001CC03BAB|nr:hypothetical protein [Dyadobacter fermentans]MBZ1356828.1 hypothetical protein [Dyadobacter fermentans]